MLVAVTAIGAFYYFRADEEVRARVRQTLSDAFPEFTIYVGSARLIEGEGIRVRDVSLMRPSNKESAQRSELIFIDELSLRCSTSPAELMKGKPNIRQIFLRNLTVRPTRHRDGSWNLEELLPLPQLGNSQPDVMIDGATIEVVDHVNQPTSVLTLTNVKAKIIPRRDQRTEGVPSTIVDYQAEISSEHFHKATISGAFDKSGLAWNLAGHIADLRHTPELAHSLPAPLADYLAPLKAFKARAGIEFRATYEAGQPQPLQFYAKADVTQGRIQHPQLAFPFSDISGTVVVDSQGWSAKDVVAYFGEAKLTGKARWQGFNLQQPGSTEVKVRNLTMTRDLAKLLPPNLYRGWERFQPLGRFNGDLQAEFDGRRWATTATAECLDVSLLCRDFPYKIETHTRHCHTEKESTVDQPNRGHGRRDASGDYGQDRESWPRLDGRGHDRVRRKHSTG